MSAETLRRAAGALREDYGEAWLGASDDATFMLAVADWLDQAARLHESGSTGPLDTPAALAVARAYLGEPA